MRFIYLQNPTNYLKLKPSRDVIEWQLDSVFDINGWDVTKALRLLHSSNPTLFEWSNSPIIYKSTPEWLAIQEVMPSFFSKKASIFHYLHSAQSAYQNYLQKESILLKKYFYALRPLLACRWIMLHETPPPILLEQLTSTMLEPDLLPLVHSLLDRKKDALEAETCAPIPLLHHYIEHNLSFFSAYAKELPANTPPSWESLDQLFLKILPFDVEK